MSWIHVPSACGPQSFSPVPRRFFAQPRPRFPESLPRGETLHISEDDLKPSIPDVPQNPLKFCAPTPEGEGRFFHRGSLSNPYPKRLWNLCRGAKVFSIGLLAGGGASRPGLFLRGERTRRKMRRLQQSSCWRTTCAGCRPSPGFIRKSASTLQRADAGQEARNSDRERSWTDFRINPGL
jgi:hypothetical protein